MPRLIMISAIASLVFLFAARTVDAQQNLATDRASSFVFQFIDEAVSDLSVPSRSPEQRVETVRRLMSRYTSGDMLSEKLIGRAWSAASDEQRARFRHSLMEYLATMCAGFATDVSPATRVIVTGAELHGDRVLVHSVIIPAPDEQIPVDWAVAEQGERLVVADASAEGVSLIRTMQSDFRAVLFANSGNLDSLIAAIGSKIKVATD